MSPAVVKPTEVVISETGAGNKTHRFELRLTDEEFQKLEKLAEYRRMSKSECIRRFIQTSSPGGSGWSHPSMKKKD